MERVQRTRNTTDDFGGKRVRHVPDLRGGCVTGCAETQLLAGREVEGEIVTSGEAHVVTADDLGLVRVRYIHDRFEAIADRVVASGRGIDERLAGIRGDGVGPGGPDLDAASDPRPASVRHVDQGDAAI